MTQLARFELDGGGSVLVEVDDEPGVQRAGRPGKLLVQEAKSSFANALADVRDAASAALNQFRAMTDRPDEVEIKFGVQMDAEAGAVIARTGISGTFEVKVTWRRPTDNAPSGS
jgi:Trypsin-co-occurring domain 1